MRGWIPRLIVDHALHVVVAGQAFAARAVHGFVRQRGTRHGNGACQAGAGQGTLALAVGLVDVVAIPSDRRPREDEGRSNTDDHRLHDNDTA